MLNFCQAMNLWPFLLPWSVSAAPLGGWCPPADCRLHEDAQEMYWISIVNWDSFKSTLWSKEGLAWFYLPLADTLRQMECLFIYQACEHSDGLLLHELCNLYQQILASGKALGLDLLGAFEACGADEQLLLMPCKQAESMDEGAWRLLRQVVACSVSILEGLEMGGADLDMHYWHSPSAVCFRDNLTWWHEEPPELVDLASLERDAWVINLGTADGSCRRLQQALPRGKEVLFESQDPANCLLSKGVGGIFIEGNQEDYEQLRKKYASRSDAKLVQAQVDPGIFQSIVSGYIAERQG